MRTNYCFLFFENPDVAIDLYVSELLIVKAPQCSGDLVLSLVIEEHIVSVSVVIDLKLGPHWLFKPSQEPSHNNHIIDWLSIEFTHIIRPRL